MFDNFSTNSKQGICCPNCQTLIEDLPQFTYQLPCPMCEVIIDIRTEEYKFPDKFYQKNVLFKSLSYLNLDLGILGKIEDIEVKITAINRYQKKFQKYNASDPSIAYESRARNIESFELTDTNTNQIAFYLLRSKEGFVLQEPIVVPYPNISEVAEKLELNFMNPLQPKKVTEYGEAKLIWGIGEQQKPAKYDFFQYEDKPNHWFSVELADDSNNSTYYKERKVKTLELRNYFSQDIDRQVIKTNVRIFQFLNIISWVAILILSSLLILALFQPKKVIFEQSFPFGTQYDSIPQISREWSMQSGVYLLDIKADFANLNSEVYTIIEIFDDNDLQINELEVDFWQEFGFSQTEDWRDEKISLQKYFYTNKDDKYSMEIRNFCNPAVYTAEGKISIKISKAGLIWYYFLFPFLFFLILLIFSQVSLIVNKNLLTD